MHRTSFFTMLLLCLTFMANAQRDELSKNLPPIAQLPKNSEVKTFFEFEAAYDYTLHNADGEIVLKGNAQFVDVTDLPDGDYTFYYNNQQKAYHVGKKTTPTPMSKELPPFDMLPKDGNVKVIYEFEREGVYALHDANGKLLDEGVGQFVDVTEYPKGNYFFNFDGEIIHYHKE